MGAYEFREPALFKVGAHTKLGARAAWTQLSTEHTCPRDCFHWREDTCFVRSGDTYNGLGRVDRALRRAAERSRLTPSEQVHLMARKIRDLDYAGAPLSHELRISAVAGLALRLFIGGDVTCKRDAEELAWTAETWPTKHPKHDDGRPYVFGFTHRWREISRAAFGRISILASVENIADARAAMARGYGVARTVDRFNDPSHWDEGDVRMISCSQETRGTKCDRCKLCFDDHALRGAARVVAFETHGTRAEHAAAVLRHDARQRLPVMGARK